MTTFFDDPDELRQVDAYIDQLRTQDDRSCVIMIAARVESLLERAINKRLIDPLSNRRRGWVPNLANTIDLSYRLGILHASHADALHALRRIRNRAAHFDEPMTLEDQRQDVDHFCRPWLEGRAASQFRLLVEHASNASSADVRPRFLIAAFTFFVFFNPLATVAPQLNQLSWLNALDT